MEDSEIIDIMVKLNIDASELVRKFRVETTGPSKITPNITTVIRRMFKNFTILIDNGIFSEDRWFTDQQVKKMIEPSLMRLNVLNGTKAFQYSTFIQYYIANGLGYISDDLTIPRKSIGYHTKNAYHHLMFLCQSFGIDYRKLIEEGYGD